MTKRLLLLGAIPLFFFLLFTLLQITGVLQMPEYRMYDLFLHIKPPVTEDPSILFVDIDDNAIEQSNTSWPWPRDYYGQGLIVLKEFGAKNIVFDLIFQESSPPGINLQRKKGVNDTISREYVDIQEKFIDFVTAIYDGSIPVSQLGDFAQYYLDEVQGSGQRVVHAVDMLAEDRDEFFGNAARVFGNASFIAVTLEESSSIKEFHPPDDKIYYKNITSRGEIAKNVVTVISPIPPLEKSGATFGFPEVVIDSDGVRRRIGLLDKLEDKYLPQLAFSALLGMMKNPQMDVYPDHIELKNAWHPGLEKTVDFSIPLDEKGNMLINWPPKKFEQSFRHLSFWWLIRHEVEIERTVDSLNEIARAEADGLIYTSDKISGFLSNTHDRTVQLRQALLAGDKEVTFEMYTAARERFIEQLPRYFSAEKEQELIHGIANMSASAKSELTAMIQNSCREARESYAYVMEIRDVLKKELPGSMCFTSWTAISTTDLGVNPFDGKYVNVGTHGSIVNTILQQQFLDESPSWITLFLTLIFTAATFFVIQTLKRPLFSVLAGSGGIVVVFIGFALFFVITGIYIAVLPPLLSVAFTFITLTVINFVQTAKEKNFIRNAFSHYLSKDVINELIADPDKLKLGGVQRRITAMFTDIKGFSTLSETLTPEHLVMLLNEYLTEMSNVILELGGTIDKYIGDAIVSFFGAPVQLEHHAELACRSAVLMHKIEMKLNEHLLAEGKRPTPLFTRFGINTGEMVVGNMGTAKKLNYTIMGNHVNFAARLEGVNKQYGTAILIAQATYEEGAEKFLTRQLDRVQVVGIKKPVQIYELIDEKSEARPEMFELVAIFEEALGLFRNQEWDKAKHLFQKVLKLNETDGPAEKFIKRCEEYKKKPPAKNWDGVFSLTTK
ncbi:MAG: CHASE2 domain-containing protein [Spirochaetales bacterium]|nr:CHASE2 domain-containing protein [Spirochaetales bacterium]